MGAAASIDTGSTETNADTADVSPAAPESQTVPNLKETFLDIREKVGGGICIEEAIPGKPAEQFAFKVVAEEYSRIHSSDFAIEGEEDTKPYPNEEAMYSRLESLYKKALLEKDTGLPECMCPSVIIYKYDKLGEEQKKEYQQGFLDAVEKREKESLKAKKAAAKSASADYSQSFGGTAEDTKNEKEAAEILRGDDQSNAAMDEDPILRTPDILNIFERNELRKTGRWFKYLGAEGCYMFQHLLTKDIVSVRPEDFVEDVVVETQVVEEEAKDEANGLRRIDLPDLMRTVDELISEKQKTPLFIDRSPSQPLRTFFNVKAMLEDVSCLTVPYAKSGIKKQDVMERCRKKLVGAIKTGATFVLYLGDIRTEHADFVHKLCKKDVFPTQTFVNGGRKLLGPSYDPAFKKIFREEDMVSGQAIAKEDGFQVVVISTLDPYEYEEGLGESLQLGCFVPIFVNYDD